MILCCRECRTKKEIAEDATIKGKPAMEWFVQDRDLLCADCFPLHNKATHNDPTIELLQNELDATVTRERSSTEKPAPVGKRKAKDGQRQCSFCERPETEVRLEWSLEMVWRHDRTLTDGSRTVDAKRSVIPHEYACQSCINKFRKGVAQHSAQLL